VKSGETNAEVKWIADDRDAVDGEMDWLVKGKKRDCWLRQRHCHWWLAYHL